MSTEDRYQFQPWYIKTYRWLRWRPVYGCLALAHIFVWWFIDGKIPVEEQGWFVNKWQFVKFLWRLSLSDASMKMKHYYTMDEVITELRSKVDAQTRPND
jgi:hypothetical protein